MTNSTLNSYHNSTPTQPQFDHSWGSSWGFMFEHLKFVIFDFKLNSSTFLKITSHAPGRVDEIRPEAVSWGQVRAPIGGEVEV